MSSVLVDTTVWIDHLRTSNEELLHLLNRDLALTHPMDLGEIACGTPPSPRAQTLRDLGLLPMVQQTGWRETIGFIERESAYGLGCGFVDMVLLTSTLITSGAKLWTLDKKLAALTQRFGVSHRVKAG